MSRNFERWLYRTVHGRPAPRASRTTPRRGPARNWRYCAWIRTLPCAACGTTLGVQAAHTGDDGGMSQKASDYSCVPLCFSCHREYDNGLRSKELFEQDHRIIMPELVRRLTHDWFAYSREVK